MGMFIRISVKNRKFLNSEAARQLVEACSVDIFERRNGCWSVAHGCFDEAKRVV